MHRGIKKKKSWPFCGARGEASAPPHPNDVTENIAIICLFVFREA